MNGGKQQVCGYRIMDGVVNTILKHKGQDDWVTACFFQNTTKVLRRAALQGLTTCLNGVINNMSMGGVMAAGTGFMWRKITGKI